MKVDNFRERRAGVRCQVEPYELGHLFPMSFVQCRVAHDSDDRHVLLKNTTREKEKHPRPKIYSIRTTPVLICCLFYSYEKALLLFGAAINLYPLCTRIKQ